MIDVSLTRFVDFVIKSGTPKLTVVRQTKQQHQEEYSPAKDYYKQIRDAIIAHHRDSKPFSTVDHVATNVNNRSKQENYPLIARGYKKFLGRKNARWFSPPHQSWVHGNLQVSLNPELGLEINGECYVIKLYFKGDKPRKAETKAILALMEMQLQTPTRPKRMAILDVRRAKLLAEPAFNPSLVFLMQGEAVSFASIYDSV